MKKRVLSLLMCLCLCITMVPVTAFAAAKNIEVTNANYYNNNGDLKDLTIDFGWDTASATSRLTVMTKKLRSAGEAGTDRYYGDFTDYGYYGSAFKNWNEVLNNSSKFGMIYYADEHKMQMGKTNSITVSFDKGDIPLDKNQTYYLYLWTYYGGNYYPDNLFMVLQVKNGKLQYAPATDRNSYGSFTTLKEMDKSSSSNTNKNNNTTNNKPTNTTNSSSSTTTSKAGSTSNKPSSGINVSVEGKYVVWTDAKPFISGGRTLVPLRPIANALGLDVTWDASKNTAHFTNGNVTVSFELGVKEYTYATKKGINATSYMDTAAISKNGRTYAPVKYLSESFGYGVRWDAATQTALLYGSNYNPNPADQMDPMPPLDVTKQPAWYGYVTQPKFMSDERLMKEYYALDTFIEKNNLRTESTLIRLYDLWDAIAERGLKDAYYAKY